MGLHLKYYISLIALTLIFCSKTEISDNEKSYNTYDMYFIGTLDGYINAYDSEVNQLWKINLGRPLITVNIDMKNITLDHKNIFPGQDGNLYMADTEMDEIEKLDVSIKSLIENSPFTLPYIPNYIYLGSRLTTIFIIDIERGKIISKISSDKKLTSIKYINSTQKILNEKIITIIRSDYILKSINKNSAQSMWNVTISEVILLEKGSKKEISYDEYYMHNIMKSDISLNIKKIMNKNVVSLYKFENKLPLMIYNKKIHDNKNQLGHFENIINFNNINKVDAYFNIYKVSIFILTLISIIAMYFCIRTYRNNLLLNEEINNLKEKVSNRENISVISTNSKLDKSIRSTNTNELRENVNGPVFKDNFEGEYNSDTLELEIEIDKIKNTENKNQTREYVGRIEGICENKIKKVRAVSSDNYEIKNSYMEKTSKCRPRAESNDNYHVNKFYNENIKNELESLYNTFIKEQTFHKLNENEHIYDLFSDSDSSESEMLYIDELDSGRFHKNFEDISLIGKGGYGCVFKARHKIDGYYYAIKILKLKIDNNISILELNELKEIKTMMKLEHKNIVRYITCWFESKRPDEIKQRSRSVNDWDSKSKINEIDISSCDKYSSNIEFFKDNPSRSYKNENLISTKKIKRKKITVFLYMQIEYCKGLSLSYYLENRKFEFSRKIIFLNFKQILYAVHHIHKHNIIHRDLKPGNIFIHENFKLKIGDFGLATDINIDLNEKVGTPLYQSPEQIEGKAYDEKVDIWSLGLIFLELCYLFKTHQEKREIFINIRVNQKYPKKIKEKYLHEYRIIKQMTCRESNKRISAEEILNSYEYKYLKERFNSNDTDE